MIKKNRLSPQKMVRFENETLSQFICCHERRALGRIIVISSCCKIICIQCDVSLEDKESPDLQQPLKPHISHVLTGRPLISLLLSIPVSLTCSDCFSSLLVRNDQQRLPSLLLFLHQAIPPLLALSSSLPPKVSKDS